ncbi:MAG: rubrerythrin family protein [Actinomycetota bacterium]|nr:rubrerythrin family protein [Actinomycetota bacterium]
MEQKNTGNNLFKAFEGEAKASVRLQVYAEKALKDGYPGVAKLFRAIASSETIHAKNALEELGAIRDTEENLSDSLTKEEKIAQVSYSSFITDAENEGENNAALYFSWARDVEEIHARLYEKALEHLLADETPTYYVCSVCGYVSDGRIPEKCPVCGSPSKVFRETPEP